MKHKSGDVVTIRTDMVIDGIYDNMDVTPEMLACGGARALILNTWDDSYEIDIDKRMFSWTDAMFED